MADALAYLGNSLPVIYDFQQGYEAQTITFSGNFIVVTREFYGYIVINGQSGTTGMIPFYFPGSGSWEQPSSVAVGPNGDGVTASGLNINIPQGAGGSWGHITVVLRQSVPGLVITCS